MSATVRYKFLIGDGDAKMGNAIKVMLDKMGFPDTRLVGRSDDAYAALHGERYDIVIMDWTMQGMNAPELVRRVRREARMPRPNVPILMLSGRAEEADILAVRNAGINEYVRKPFTAYTLFSRLENLVSNPKPFVIAHGYVGPCRRNQGEKPLVERRRSQPEPRKMAPPLQRNPKPTEKPLILAPDMTLKNKIAPHAKLGKAIDLEAINAAQASMDNMGEEAQRWILDDLRHLNIYCHALMADEYAPFTSGAFTTRALSLHTRAGTFGYEFAGEIAGMLYRFSRLPLIPREAAHKKALRKHLDILQLLVTSHIRTMPDHDSVRIANELRKLSDEVAVPVMRLPTASVASMGGLSRVPVFSSLRH